MKESPVSEQLTMRWVPVVDTQGRTRMEAVWSAAPAAVSHSHAATHAA